MSIVTDLENHNLRPNLKESKPQGIHILADIYDITAGREEMLYVESLKEFTLKAVDKVKLTRVGESFVQFPEAGVTGVVLLAESHIAIHTWPEKNYVTLDIFVCNVSQDNRIKARALFKMFENLFKARDIKYQEVERE